MSPAASGLVRALIGRARVPRDRILLSEIRSVDWQSLTFTGERHKIALRVPGPNSGEIAERLTARLEDAEFSIPGVLVADIGVAGAPQVGLDGATSLIIEALTIASD
jgi:hypothetical protein